MSSLALYRAYRPGSLADVIGQEHVTVPLARAIDSGRAHHAYLFTGPRGCGKTSSARILARSLNCDQGPTSTPCGVCDSCVALAPNGPGSIDVIELDAASNGGVDEARDLRDRAVFAPAAGRFKVYILDEAHQLSNAAANALLKLIEEPPPHLRFVFATTEADKILPTIRSRTHHYPFRLVPQRRLAEHLAWICEQESVPAESAALALIARAGAGSVRDSLSVLGQVIGGSGAAGVTYDDAVGLLGVTDAALLDDVVAALASGDAASLFTVVDAVVEAGHDPRRFAVDLLERLRDLVVLSHVPDAAASGLVTLPDATLATMAEQAAAIGPASLSRAADLVADGLAELKGATAPRLALELLCARLVLPGADDSVQGLGARLERLERRLAGVDLSASAAAPSYAPARAADPSPLHATGSSAAPPDRGVEADASALRSAPARAPAAPGGPPARPIIASAGTPTVTGDADRSVDLGPSTADVDDGGVSVATAPSDDDASPHARPDHDAHTGDDGGAERIGVRVHDGRGDDDPPSAAPTVPPTAASTAGDLAAFTGMWPAVLDALKRESRVAWTALAQSTPVSVGDGTLAVALPQQGVITFARSGGHDERLRQAILDVLRVDVRPDLVLDPGRTAQSSTAPTSPASSPPAAPAAGGSAGVPRSPAPTAAPDPVMAPAARPTTDDPPTSPVDAARARLAAQPSVGDDPEIDESDPDLDEAGLAGVPLVQQMLGGTVVTEYENG